MNAIGRTLAASPPPGKGVLASRVRDYNPPVSLRSVSAGRVLVMDDEEDLAGLIAGALGEAGYDVSVAHTVAGARRLLHEREFEVALLDMHLPDGKGVDVLREVVDSGAMTEVIMLTGDRDISHVVQVMKLGATDYLTKPTPLSDLELAVGQARDRQRLRSENRALKVRLERHEQPSAIVTEDPAYLHTLSSLPRIGASDLPVLIQGESGTGKALLARAIHDSSHRRLEPFLEISCAGRTEPELEAELFGYERGAIASASERKPGLFEVADRGTLYIDEIGDMGASVQARLLKVLETGEFSRLGSERLVRARMRLVAGTSRSLSDLVTAGGFRQALHYQLNGIGLQIPPLRERPNDILPLALHFLRLHGIRRSLSPQALEVLKAYSWPGNVRELQMVIRRAAALGRGDRIEARDLSLGQ